MASTQFARIHSTLLLAMSLDPHEIGQRLKAAREAKGWTQLQFALEANVSPSSVARWESGKLPPVRELLRLALVLEIPPEELVERPDGPIDPERLEEALVEVGALRGEIRELADLVRALLEESARSTRDTALGQ